MAKSSGVVCAGYGKKKEWGNGPRGRLTRQKSSSGRLLPPPSASAGLCERETGLRTHTAHAHTHTHIPPLCISHYGRGRGTRRSRAKEEECSSTGALAHPSPHLRPIRSLSSGASTHARTLGGTLLSPPPPGQGPIDPALYPPDPPTGRVAPVTRPPRHKKDEQRESFDRVMGCSLPARGGLSPSHPRPHPSHPPHRSSARSTRWSASSARRPRRRRRRSRSRRRR